MIFFTYGNVYVARVSLGTNPCQIVKAMNEAEAYDGPSIIIAYAHCINHGLNIALGLDQPKKAGACGHWPLYRYNPVREDGEKNLLSIDSKEPSIDFAEYALAENRYRMLKMTNPEMADEFCVVAAGGEQSLEIS